MIKKTKPSPQRTVSLARALSKFGLTSRSQARTIIKDGRVHVNNTVTRNPDSWVDLKNDRIEVDGTAVRRKPFVYLAFHKPVGYVTTRSDERGRKTVYDLLDSRYQSLFPVGRLDKETSGLLLFMNDTQFGERVTSPASKLGKTYEVVLDRALLTKDAETIRGGISVDEVRYLPAGIKYHPDAISLEITIFEGKNRQIRRMFEALKYRVLTLHRKSIGDVHLGGLPSGKARELTATEVEKLRRKRMTIIHQ